MLWLFRDVTLQMQKVRRETVGRTRGVSVRVCKGVYYRTGGFRGRPVETPTMGWEFRKMVLTTNQCSLKILTVGSAIM